MCRSICSIRMCEHELSAFSSFLTWKSTWHPFTRFQPVPSPSSHFSCVSLLAPQQVHEVWAGHLRFTATTCHFLLLAHAEWRMIRWFCSKWSHSTHIIFTVMHWWLSPASSSNFGGTKNTFRPGHELLARTQDVAFDLSMFVDAFDNTRILDEGCHVCRPSHFSKFEL